MTAVPRLGKQGKQGLSDKGPNQWLHRVDTWHGYRVGNSWRPDVRYWMCDIDLADADDGGGGGGGVWWGRVRCQGEQKMTAQSVSREIVTTWRKAIADQAKAGGKRL